MPARSHRKLESALDDAEARVLKAETLAAAERKEVDFTYCTAFHCVAAGTW